MKVGTVLIWLAGVALLSDNRRCQPPPGNSTQFPHPLDSNSTARLPPRPNSPRPLPANPPTTAADPQSKPRLGRLRQLLLRRLKKRLLRDSSDDDEDQGGGSFNLFGSNFWGKLKAEFSALTGFDDKPKSKVRYRQPTVRTEEQEMLRMPKPNPLFTENPLEHLTVEEPMWARAREMLEAKPAANATSEWQVGFKKVKLPTLSLKEEFGSRFEESFDLGFGETMFDLFLDDIGERDAKLVDVGNKCVEKKLMKFDSIVRDSAEFVN